MIKRRMQHVYVVEAVRGNIVECRFKGSLVVTNSMGEVLLTVGNGDHETTVRSTVKPFQLVPLIEHGGIEAFHLSSEEIAFMAGSHEGELPHVNLGRTLIEKHKIKESSLLCSPAPLEHNCSGKHIGMILLSRLLNVSEEGYNKADHPVQQQIRLVIENMLEYSQKTPNPIDGCNIPTYCSPLRNLAKAYARFAEGDTGFAYGSALKTIRDAVMAHPFLVGGTYRLETDLMSMMPLVAKIGAQGLYCVGIPSRRIGLALKIESGSSDASECLAVEALKELGVFDDESLASLDKYRFRPITTTFGIQAGYYRPLRLKPILS